MNDTTTTDPGAMLPAVGTGDDLATRMRYAEALAGARLLPGPYRRSPADVLLAVEYAAALGLAAGEGRPDGGMRTPVAALGVRS